MGMSLCSPLRFGICDLYNMFCVVPIQYFYRKFVYILLFYVNSLHYDNCITVETVRPVEGVFK